MRTSARLTAIAMGVVLGEIATEQLVARRAKD